MIVGFGDLELVQSLLTWMQEQRADFTNTFRDLSPEVLPAGECYGGAGFHSWHSKWQQRLAREERPRSLTYAAMNAVNAAVIPRNHRVEEALVAAEENDGISVLNRLLAVLANPYELAPESASYQEPQPDECNYRTFCGT